MPRSTTISIRAISSPAKFTSRDALPHWPSGAPSRLRCRLGWERCAMRKRPAVTLTKPRRAVEVSEWVAHGLKLPRPSAPPESRSKRADISCFSITIFSRRASSLGRPCSATVCTRRLSPSVGFYRPLAFWPLCCPSADLSPLFPPVVGPPSVTER